MNTSEQPKEVETLLAQLNTPNALKPSEQALSKPLSNFWAKQASKKHTFNNIKG